MTKWRSSLLRSLGALGIAAAVAVPLCLPSPAHAWWAPAGGGIRVGGGAVASWLALRRRRWLSLPRLSLSARRSMRRLIRRPAESGYAATGTGRIGSLATGLDAISRSRPQEPLECSQSLARNVVLDTLSVRLCRIPGGADGDKHLDH